MSLFEHFAERELKYHVRREIASGIRKSCPQDDNPMVSGITVMLGTVLTMAAFSVLLNGHGRGRTR